jgi:hypothetical protein
MRKSHTINIKVCCVCQDKNPHTINIKVCCVCQDKNPHTINIKVSFWYLCTIISVIQQQPWYKISPVIWTNHITHDSKSCTNTLSMWWVFVQQQEWYKHSVMLYWCYWHIFDKHTSIDSIIEIHLCLNKYFQIYFINRKCNSFVNSYNKILPVEI